MKKNLIVATLSVLAVIFMACISEYIIDGALMPTLVVGIGFVGLMRHKL
jgi:preprotein translocase subunit SecE